MFAVRRRWWGWLGALVLVTTGGLPSKSVLCSEADGVRLELAAAGRCLERWVHTDGDRSSWLETATSDLHTARRPTCSDLDLPEGWSGPGAAAVIVPSARHADTATRGPRLHTARTDRPPAKTRIHLQLRLLLN